MTEILDARTDVGAVTLKVGDLDGMTDYYSRGIGLSVLEAEGDRVTLGRLGVPAVVLEHTPLLKHAPSTAAGLFHTAILFDEQSALASSVYSVAQHFPSSFTGSSDHLVSKALYFDDPEGNGVELYWDRPRDSGAGRTAASRWPRTTWTRTGSCGSTSPTPTRSTAPPQWGTSTSGRRHRDGPAVLRGHPRLRGDRGVRHPGTVRVGRRLPPPPRDEHLAEPRRAGRWPALGLGEVTIELPTDEERGALAPG